MAFVVLIATLSACRHVALDDLNGESQVATPFPVIDVNVEADSTMEDTINPDFVFDTFNTDILYQHQRVETIIDSSETSIQIIGDEKKELDNAGQDIIKIDNIVKVEQNNEFFPKTPDNYIVRKKRNIQFCEKIDNKLHSVSFHSCLVPELYDSLFNSHHGQPILYTDFLTEPKTSLGRVLLLGGVHGDELTSVSSVFNWIGRLSGQNSRSFSWRVVPLVNPDGFFLSEPSRTNAAGVDLNRNMPTTNWNDLASRYWYEKENAVPRKFPGLKAGSEPETQWLMYEIEKYKPDVIVSVHAPYDLVDYDAVNRSNAPKSLGSLPGKLLGTFPGSLGRYAGEQRNIPVITIELPHSTKMPRAEEIRKIWVDLEAWLQSNIGNRKPTTDILNST